MTCLSKHMGTHEDFYVQHLCEEEAWILFKKTVGDSMENNLELLPITTEAVKECECWENNIIPYLPDI